MKYIWSIWYPSDSIQVGSVTDTFWDFAQNVENDNLIITHKLSFERLEEEAYHTIIYNLHMPVFIYHWENTWNLFDVATKHECSKQIFVSIHKFHKSQFFK